MVVNRPSYLGSIVFFVWWIIITPPFSLLACLIAPLPPLVRYRIIAQWSRLTVWGLRRLCGIRYQVYGLSNLPSDPVVFLSRHESAWETIAYQVILPPQAFVLKRSLLKIPFFGWGLKQMSPIAINRTTPVSALQQIKKQGKQRLAEGFCISIFPEGSRMPPGQYRRYFSGGAALAKAAGVPVVPIALDSGHCWGKNRFFKRRGLITVHIGKPIATDTLPPDEINAQAKTWIEATLNKAAANKN